MLERKVNNKLYEKGYEEGRAIGNMMAIVGVVRRKKISAIRASIENIENSEDKKRLMAEYKKAEKILNIIDPDWEDIVNFVDKYPNLNEETLAKRIISESEYMHFSLL